MSPGTIALVVLALVGLWALVTYNKLVALRVRAENAWSDIDVQLKRRWDLVPRLVETVRGYASHERTTFEQVTLARSRAQEQSSPGARGQAENALGGLTIQVLALAESYPDLKASEIFRSLHTGLIEVEDHLQSARRYYNAVVRDFNTMIQQFPASLIAGPGGFRALEYFQLDAPDEAIAPRISLEAGHE